MIKKVEVDGIEISVENGKYEKVVRICCDAETLTIAHNGKYHVASSAGVWLDPATVDQQMRTADYTLLPTDDAAQPEVDSFDLPDKYSDDCTQMLRMLACWHSRDPRAVRAVLHKISMPDAGCRRMSQYSGLSKSQLHALYRKIAHERPALAGLLHCRRESDGTGRTEMA